MNTRLSAALVQTVRTACERLERHVVYRGTCSGGNQRSRIYRSLESASGNEENVLVPDRNILSFATQQFLHVYLLLLKPILSMAKQSRFSGGGDVSWTSGDSYDLQNRDF